MEPAEPSQAAQATRPRRTGTEVGNRVRVWWSPTSHRTKTDYSGMYWPARVLGRPEGKYEVQYDNGDREVVDEENVSPNPQLVDFGAEERPLQAGEFVEVFNNSASDPAEWLACTVKVNKKSIVVEYPFHDADNETVSDTLIRRARIWDYRTCSWSNIKPFQTWEDGEVSAPVELESCNAQELYDILARHSRKRRPVEGHVAPSGAVADSSDNGLSLLPASTAASSQDGHGRDPRLAANPPQVPRSAYGHFLNERRPLAKHCLGPNASDNDISLKVAEYWRAATPMDKLPFLQSAEADKARYDAEIAAYTLPDEELPEVQKKKAKKDPNAPKRPRSAYILYSMDFRKGLGPTHFNEATMLAAASWKRADQETTAKYQAQADLERQAYSQAHKIYLANRQKAEREEAAARTAAAAAVAMHFEQEQTADALQQPQLPAMHQDLPGMQSPAAPYVTPAPPPPAFQPPDLAPAMFPLQQLHPPSAPAIAACGPEVQSTGQYPDQYAASTSATPQHQQHGQAADQAYEYGQHSHWPAPAYGQGPGEVPQLLQLRPHQRAALAAAAGMGSVPSGVTLPMSAVTAALESLDLEHVKTAFQKLRIDNQAYYMLCDVWRTSSPKVHDAVRAFKQHVENRPNKPDWKGFLIGIFGLQAINPHLPNNMRWGCKYIDKLGRHLDMQQYPQQLHHT